VVARFVHGTVPGGYGATGSYISVLEASFSLMISPFLDQNTFFLSKE
jgi:hypothetical protein